MAREIRENLSSTFFEYRLLPRLTTLEQTPDKIVLRTPLCNTKEGLMHINLPFTSAVMQAVSGADLSISLARQGGLGFIFCSQPIEEQAKMVAKVKNYKAGFVKSASNLPPDAELKDIQRITKETGHSTIPITKDGKNNSELLGIVTDMDYWPDDEPNTKARDIMTPISNMTYVVEGISLEDAYKVMRETKKSTIPVVNNENEKILKYLVFKKDYVNHKFNPQELLDEHNRLKVGAGINTHDYEERVTELAKNGVDVVVIDTSEGYSVYVQKTLRWVKENYPEIPVGAGNVVTRNGFRFLAEQGADFIKVGIGGGSICITQEQKGIGRGQATALKEVVDERDKYYKETGVYIPICSDGGLVQDSHIMMALAFGADFVMMGRYFARFKESPTPLKEVKGELVKPYWGEGSDRARNWQRYYGGGSKIFKFEEGVDGYVPYAGQLDDNLERTVSVIKATMGNVGCESIKTLHDEAIIERVSPASIREGKAHDIIQSTEQSYDKITWG